MMNLLSRRKFVFLTMSIGVTHNFLARDLPTPRVYQLAHWRRLKELDQLKRAFEFLESDAINTRAPGRYEIDAKRMYATIVQDKTRPADAAQFEAHRKYIDLHYLMRGRELIGSAAAISLRETAAYDSEKEAALYERPRKYRRLILNPGSFVVFFPGQAHMPGCDVEKSEEIRKVVVKILAEPS